MTDRHQDTPKHLAALIENVARIIQIRAHVHGVHPVQWSALRYFLRAGVKARTVNGLARYQGTTATPASRTIGALISKSYLKATTDPKDRRSKIIEVTPQGRKILKRDPLQEIEAALARLETRDQVALSALMEKMLFSLQKIDDSKEE